MEDVPGSCSSVSSEETGPETGDSSPAEDGLVDGLVDAFGGLAALPVEVVERRPTCLRCRRPQKVCLCPFLPPRPLEVSTCLYVVQHPAEESRVLRTVPLLAACLPPGKCTVIVGRRFSEEKYPELAAVCRDSRTLILYPGPKSQNLEELVQNQNLEERVQQQDLEELVQHQNQDLEELVQHQNQNLEERVQHQDLEELVQHQNQNLEERVQHQDLEELVQHQNLEERVQHQDLEERVQHQNLEELVQHQDLEELVQHQDLEERVQHQNQNLEELVQQQDLEELVQHQNQDVRPAKHNVIIIDGTWSQAKNMFLKNSLFHLPKQVQLNRSLSSQYVIRTQPSNICLSTLECAAVALSILERNDHIQEVLLRPLKALCSFQLQHGAQIHHSKEHLLKNGMYDKPMPKNKRKIKRMEKLVTDHSVCPR
ncbi:tRNA-uridine aminocarboxypropyltransferase 2 [Centropristis striata]|uniref:tRNA-uridine aminocarboxypropyltransferase 2 n=1 Tax=Centropristis striata TaxID=184440 RepID=UPI0027E064C1|nr:tRNA-uridine aminocarboxypropyltransferase 2 [Centropristis striata]